MNTPYFFCGIGGSGMLPLALIVKTQGNEVAGSDRAFDAGRTLRKFEFLEARGIKLYPQDGSGIRKSDTQVVVSTAVEDTVPDIVAARRVGAPLVKRADLLAQLFNGATLSIGVAGTSGKSTTTGMIAWIMKEAGRSPTVMNGAVMKNFIDPQTPFASASVGKGDVFVSEIDESDGSIALFKARIAVINNIALDHKPMEELRVLFSGFIARADTVVYNRDNEEVRRLVSSLTLERALSYGLDDASAHVRGASLNLSAEGTDFVVEARDERQPLRVSLKVPGRHNVANALAALTATRAAGIPLNIAARALGTFTGIRRRLETAGVADGVTVIDDFAHNPDKIAATLTTLHASNGRLLVMFQPHGYGPLRLMKNELIDVFAHDLAKEDVLLMPEPVYFGGTVSREVSSADIANGVRSGGRQAWAFPDRHACGMKLLEIAHSGDKIVVMGARDDTLSEFATGLVESLNSRKTTEK